MSSLTRYTKKQTPSITGKKTPDSKKTGNKKNKKKEVEKTRRRMLVKHYPTRLQMKIVIKIQMKMFY